MFTHKSTLLKPKKGGLRSTLLAVVMTTLPALAFSVDAAPLVLTKSISKKQQDAALVQWTRNKIAATPALAMPVDTGWGGVDTAAADLAEVAATGPVGSTPSGMAKSDATGIAQAAYEQDWAALEDGLALEAPTDVPTGTPGVYTSYTVNLQAALWNIYPHKWDGRLLFNTPSGGAACSATVISGNNIVTAAHCVYDTTANRFYSGWAFTPAYRNGSAPFGVFTAASCTVLTAWANLAGGFSINSWTRHDVAVCKLNRNSAGQTINAAVGWAGRLWNAGYQQLAFNSGYPANDYNLNPIPSPLQYLRSCTAESFLQTTETLGSGCNWGQGISGGSWLLGYKPFLVSGQVNSVNSGLFIGQQNLYGARFNSSNIVPLCNASGC